jgi:hypothetical protein
MSEHPFGQKIKVAEYLQFSDGSGVSYQKFFNNGYATSVVCHRGSYGGDEGLFELGLFCIDSNEFTENNEPTYQFVSVDEITGDDTVVGWLTEEKVLVLQEKVAKLPPVILYN